MICRHCKWRKVNRPRGLCYPCFTDPLIKMLYPASVSKFARRGIGCENVRPKSPSGPTDTRPGSAARIAVLADRAERMESLFHPDDTRISDD